ncbi:hypothetical protein FQV27_10755 [Paracoccus aurantiacus]|uniref:Uncharacterized protein n=2 Tax=Paracoccus aurantiacus TaxID=2599412 RepID=A0A5C6S252_9RHOB|nr:DUF6478 family protein [Paracoccus aurantiacus]TXB68474.1 hypothetical protein FQV27_10755 [Paracoccus aurantiacus]
MAFRLRHWIERMQRLRAEEQWARLSAGALRLRQSRLGGLRDEAMSLRRHLDRFLTQSDRRVASARADIDRVPLPGGTDWRWRPDFMVVPVSPSGVAAPENASRIAEGVAVWHDCPERALILRQVRNTRAGELAAYGLQVEVMGFGGSFMSLSIDLPRDALTNLTRDHIIRVETTIEPEAGTELYYRLNIGNGPNTEELLRHVGELQAGRMAHLVTEFDLAQTQMNEKRLEKIWLDLIVENPRMTAVTIREMILSRHPRAHI